VNRIKKIFKRRNEVADGGSIQVQFRFPKRMGYMAMPGEHVIYNLWEDGGSDGSSLPLTNSVCCLLLRDFTRRLCFWKRFY
jgi:hypothetical protein